MTTTTTTDFNPQASLPFCPAQNEMFTFLAQHGFAAIALGEVQGIVAGESVTNHPVNSWIFVKTGHLHYESIESVPELVARYSMLQQRANGQHADAPPPPPSPLPIAAPTTDFASTPTANPSSFAAKNGLWK